MATVNIRQFDDESMRKLARMADEVAYLRRQILSLRARGGFSYPNTCRIGVAYGAIGARSGTTPGRGEVKFYELNTTTYELGNLDELPTTVYNYGLATIADGEYLIAWLDLSGHESDGSGDTSWSTGSIVDDDESARYLTQVCKDTDQTISTDAETVVIFQDAINLRTSDQESWDETADGVADGIALKQVGWYRISYKVSWEGPTTSPGGSGVSIDKSTTKIGYAAGGSGSLDPMDCTSCAIFVLHDNATGASMGGSAAHPGVLYKNENTSMVIKLIHTGSGGMTSRIFLAQHCQMWAEYLGHNVTADTTHTTP